MHVPSVVAYWLSSICDIIYDVMPFKWYGKSIIGSSSLLPRPFHIDCVGRERGTGTHCFADVMLLYDFPLNVCDALYMPFCSVEVSPRHSTAMSSPEGLKGVLSGHLSWLLLLPFTEGDGLPPFICQNCWTKAESIESKLYKLHELAKDSFGKFHIQGCKCAKDSTGVDLLPTHFDYFTDNLRVYQIPFLYCWGKVPWALTVGARLSYPPPHQLSRTAWVRG